MNLAATLQSNLLAPIPLAFALGLLAKIARSDLALPKDLCTALSLYLLLAIGLKGGVELRHAAAADLAVPLLAALAVGLLTPLLAFGVSRFAGRLSPVDAAAMAAHYGSVSVVTFIAAQQQVAQVGEPIEGFMPTLLALLESPGLLVGLLLGVWYRGQGDAGAPADRPGIGAVLHEVATGRTMMLLLGGLAIGWAIGDAGWRSVSPFFEGGFRGVLMLFILEMGLVTGARLKDLRRTGLTLVALGVGLPLVQGALGVALGTAAGLSVGGATLLGTMAASASYIAAPPAVRLTLPEANPTLTLTAALAITFPFNLMFGIPLYLGLARQLA
jgi:hypothetical protein